MLGMGWSSRVHFAPTPPRSGSSNTEEAVAKDPGAVNGEHVAESDDQRLLSNLRAGRPEACAELVHAHYQRVYRFLVHLTHDVHQAEDLTQETFLKAFHGLDRFNSANAFSTWLFTIAKRTAYNHFRGMKRYEELSPESEADLDDPSVLLEQKDEKLSLWDLARKLGQDQ